MQKKMTNSGFLHHIPKHIKMLTVAGVSVLAVMVGIFVVITYAKPVKTAEQLKSEANAVLTGKAGPKQELKKISSDLGFSLKYDASLLSARGQTTDPSSTDNYVKGEDFEGSELDQPRSYSLVRINAKKKDANSTTFSDPELIVLTNIRKDHLVKSMLLPENAGKTKLQVWVDTQIASQKKSDYILVNRSEQTINGVSYTVLDFSYDSAKRYGLPSETVDRYYMTVQNDRAYYVNINNIVTSGQSGNLPLYEEVLGTISYTQPDASKFSFTKSPTVNLATTALPQTDNIKTPAGSIENNELYDIVAKNQPAVVRIGASRCADITVNFPDGTTGDLGRVCAAGIGSGFFISSDGYIATNGHVTRMLLSSLMTSYLASTSDTALLTQRIDKLLGYLVKLAVITEEDKQAVLTAWANRDRSVYSALESIGPAFPSSALTLRNDTSTYAIQTSNEPMRINDDHASFKLSKTIIQATFVDANFYEDGKRAVLDNELIRSGKSDVSILKVEGGPYPVVELGTLDAVNEGDKLIALGFPAFVDDGLFTKQNYTVPSATSGIVRSIASDKSEGGTGRMFIFSSVQIASGNSGGPSFDKDGKVIGLNTYSNGGGSCLDGKCFSNGIIRDIGDLKDLAKKNNVTISSSSDVTNGWQKGLKSFQAGDFGTAAESFDKQQKVYPANYLASQFGTIATENAPSLFRISQSDIPRTLLLYGIVALTWAILGCVIAAIVHVVRGIKQAKA